jgi:lipopolysaccharide assembly outer membrane protein LptD (OstA)
MRFWSFLLIFLFISNAIFAQRTIEILGANDMSGTKRHGKSVTVLKGNVRLSTQGALLTSDSALFYQKTNTLDAFGNVRLVKGSGDERFTITGNSMFLNGNTNLAQVRDSVVLLSKNTTLKTNFFDYNLKSESGHFWNGGITKSDESTFISDEGFFYKQQNLVRYIGNVKIDNPDFKITTNEVIHNTVTEISLFKGKTHIINDDNIIDCQRAYFNHKTDETSFAGKVNLDNKGQIIKADSIHYDKTKDLGFAFGHIQVIDTAQKMIIKGNYATYTREPNRMKVADKAFLMQYSANDTVFIHGDTLSSDYDKLTEKRILYVYKHVKVYNKNYQAKSDSMVYASSDSIIKLIGSPVLWADNNQMTADRIFLHTKNNKVEKMVLESNPFITFPEDSNYYNQIKGKEIVAYVNENKLEKIDVNSNAESIYYPKDSTNIIGYNKTESSRLVIHMNKNKVDRIAVFGIPKAKLIPLEKLGKADYFLRGFAWTPEQRPLKWSDIFVWN